MNSVFKFDDDLFEIVADFVPNLKKKTIYSHQVNRKSLKIDDENKPSPRH